MRVPRQCRRFNWKIAFISSIVASAMSYFFFTIVTHAGNVEQWANISLSSITSFWPIAVEQGEKDEKQLKREEIEKRFQHRMETMKAYCRNRPKRQRPTFEENPYNTFEHFNFSEANLMVCSPPKVASTTLDYFLIKEFIKPQQSMSMVIYRSAMRDKHRLMVKHFDVLNNMTQVKVLIVRDPLDRVLSCWYDKFSGLMGQNYVHVSQPQPWVSFKLY